MFHRSNNFCEDTKIYLQDNYLRTGYKKTDPSVTDRFLFNLNSKLFRYNHVEAASSTI